MISQRVYIFNSYKLWRKLAGTMYIVTNSYNQVVWSGLRSFLGLSSTPVLGTKIQQSDLDFLNLIRNKGTLTLDTNQNTLPPTTVRGSPRLEGATGIGLHDWRGKNSYNHQIYTSKVIDLRNAINMSNMCSRLLNILIYLT